jgi:hypothetical protein
MLADDLEWHMRQRLAPILFDDTDKDDAETQRRSAVASAAGHRDEADHRPDRRSLAEHIWCPVREGNESPTQQ